MADPTPGENTTEPAVDPAAPSTAATTDPAPAKTDPAPAAAAPATDPAPTTEAAPAADSKAVAEPVVDAIPEKYDLKIGETAVNPALLEALTPIFKDSKVTAANAQKLADAFESHRKAMIPQILARDLDALRADPELGKLNFGRTQARVNDALAAFTTPQERAQLTALGLANNPTLVRMFHRIGASMQEPPQTDAGAPVREKASRASKLYGGGDAVASKTN